MGSVATGIPTGALVVASPFENSASFCAWSYEDDSRDVDKDGEVIGGISGEVDGVIPFLIFLYFSFPGELFFLCFSWTGRIMMLGV